MNKALEHSPMFFRSHTTKAKEVVVEPDGGRFGAGLIRGVSVISVGEALGHGQWVDSEFVAAVAGQLAAKKEGAKVRYTHPDMSGDGLAKGLGRVSFFGATTDQVFGDMHFWRSARVSPDGNLSGHIMELTAEDPAAFGMSITFDPDREASKLHFIKHGGKVTQGMYGEEWDASGFKSPDPRNTKNLPHVRLKQLRTSDFVGDPAANPGGLFTHNPVLESAEQYIAFALGLEHKVPEQVMFGVSPERVSGFVSRFLSTKGLKIVKLNELGSTAEGNAPAATTIPAPVATELSATPVAAPVVAPVVETPPVVGLSNGDARLELKKYMDTFGAEGANYFANGLTFEAAQTKHIEKLSATVKQLQDKINLSSQAESVPLSSGGGDEGKPAKRTGFASKIKIREAAPVAAQ